MYKVHEQNGNWSVTRDDAGHIFPGGHPIAYEVYKEIKDKPEKAKERFERDKRGKLVEKPKKKSDD